MIHFSRKFRYVKSTVFPVTRTHETSFFSTRLRLRLRAHGKCIITALFLPPPPPPPLQWTGRLRRRRATDYKLGKRKKDRKRRNLAEESQRLKMRKGDEQRIQCKNVRNGTFDEKVMEGARDQRLDFQPSKGNKTSLMQPRKKPKSNGLSN